MDTNNILQGDWIFLHSEIYRNDQWEQYQTIENDSLHWIFNPMQEGLFGLEGVLIERDKGGKGDKDSQTTYTFDPDENLLTIDRSTYLEDGFCDICEEEIYTIEQSSQGNQEQQIYYLTLQNDPDYPAPYFRYVLLKIE
ncbi:MAG: hypothetical protein SNG27_07320 [Rikenellaceae bacterium]